MKKEINERQNLEKQIGRLQRQLSSSTSPIGDWKGIKQEEYKKTGRPQPYSDADMKEYYDKRFAVRAKINELQAQIAALPAGGENVGG